jgi:hypothetical protein
VVEAVGARGITHGEHDVSESVGANHELLAECRIGQESKGECAADHTHAERLAIVE